MPTRNVPLAEDLNSFVAARVESGRYDDANQVIRAALSSLQREEDRHDTKMANLRAAIDEGDRSGDAAEGVFERVRQSLGIR